MLTEITLPLIASRSMAVTTDRTPLEGSMLKFLLYCSGDTKQQHLHHMYYFTGVHSKGLTKLAAEICTCTDAIRYIHVDPDISISSLDCFWLNRSEESSLKHSVQDFVLTFKKLLYLFCMYLKRLAGSLVPSFCTHTQTSEKQEVGKPCE